MITAWRIVPKNWAHSAFDGEGARLYGARWNSQGRPAVYLADSRALAALEVLVHLNPSMAAQQYQIIEVNFLTKLVQEIDIPPLAAALASPSILPATQQAGDAWLTESSAPVLKVYSSIISEEPNYVLNPRHPQFPRITIGESRPFAFDQRLLEK